MDSPLTPPPLLIIIYFSARGEAGRFISGKETGMSDPQISQKRPYILEIHPGKYAWCSCGKSQRQPFCDGAHKGTNFKPVIVEIKEKQTIAWCGCKHSKNGPYCDGTHKKLSLSGKA
jgi:CDGSH-type Zn-finger protein